MNYLFNTQNNPSGKYGDDLHFIDENINLKKIKNQRHQTSKWWSPEWNFSPSDSWICTINFTLYVEIQVIKLPSQYFQTYLINEILKSIEIIPEIRTSLL